MWWKYYQCSEEINRILIAELTPQNYNITTDLRQFNEGDIIINEGDEPDNLFQMVEGKALVSVKGTEIGEIKEDEVFGEVSFLTKTTRGATVRAVNRCLVQVISRPDFDEFSEYRPRLILKLSQTLAARLNDVNKRLVNLVSFTSGG